MINESVLEKIIKEFLDEHYRIGKNKYKYSEKMADEFKEYCILRKKSDSDDIDDKILELGPDEYDIAIKRYIEKINKRYNEMTR